MIVTERLILRAFEAGDYPDVFEYQHEPLVNCFASMKLNTLDEAKNETAKKMKDSECTFAIVLRESYKVIGEIFAHPEGDEAAENKDTFSPCWMLNKDYHGRGYGYEAAKAFIDYLFTEKGARRIYAFTEDYNIASQRVCEKLGMRREGLFKEFISFVKDADGNPIFENTYQYAILKKEWELLHK